MQVWHTTTIKDPVKRIKLLVFLVIAATSFYLAGTVSARTQPGNLDLTVSPPVFDLTAEPGETLRETFRVRNNTASDMNLKVTARRMISDPNSGTPIPESEATGEELKWVGFDPGTFTAPAGEWTNVDFTITIPEDAAYGYYYVFGITPAGDDRTETTGTSVKGELLVVTLLNVKKDDAVSSAELVKFAPKNFVTEYLPVTFEAQLKNSGNVHVKPRGSIFISRGEGRETAILEVNPNFGSILPDGRRTFEASWNDGFIVHEPVMEDGQQVLDDKGNPKTHLSINWNKLTSFRVGPYTARLLLVYDDGTRDQTIEGLTTFWVIPYTAIAVILIGLIIVLILLRTVLRSYVRSQIKKSRKN